MKKEWVVGEKIDGKNVWVVEDRETDNRGKGKGEMGGRGKGKRVPSLSEAEQAATTG